MEVTDRGRRVGVSAVAAVAAVAAAAAAPVRQHYRHFDHVAFLDTFRRVRDGEGLYPASIAGLERIGAHIDQARALRQPWIFRVWALVPEDALRWSFFVVVALTATLLAARLARHPEVGLLVGVWVARAGVFGGVDAWLLFELWAIPFVLGTCLAWREGRDGLAAALSLGAMLLRETAVLLPLGFLVAARRRGRPVSPWLLSMAAAAAVLALHWSIAQDYLDPAGRSARLAGTGSLGAVADMTSFIAIPPVLGLAVWGAGLVLLWRSELRPAVLLASMPVLGIFVDRPYWGFLAMPLCITALGGLSPWQSRGPSRTRLRRPDRGATTAT